MANLNKVMLIGNLTRDPQLSYLPSQTAVVEFGLAINRNWTGKDGQKKDETCFVDCQAFAKPAEIINKYLSKGSPVFVEGRLNFSSWTSQDGSKRSKLRVTVENFQFLGGGGQGQGGGQGGGAGGGAGAGGNAPAAREDVDRSGPDDDIPF